MIYITGDTHGEKERFLYCEKDWNIGDHIIICGDFGFIFKDDDAEQAVLDELAQRPYNICFLDGNHENFAALYNYPVETWNGGHIHRIRKNIIHLMRGQIFEIEGKRFFTMGGAFSIDRVYRIEDRSWWKEEIPNGAEFNEAIANLKNADYKVDYILTHTAPKTIIRMMGFNPAPHDMELTGFFDWIWSDCNWKHWYFGHWHLDQKITDLFTAVWFETHCIE